VTARSTACFVELHAVSACQIRLSWFLGEPVLPKRRIGMKHPGADLPGRVHGAGAGE
jgi:hypothetical protein